MTPIPTEIEKRLLPWHTEQWQGLMQDQRAGRLPHALILAGAHGLGKNHFAELLAQSLLCAQPQSDGQACNACRSCLLFQSGNHPDFIHLHPSEESKFIIVDQVRELTSRLAMKSQYGGYQVVLISPAEQMNLAAANSLLKTLEEPGHQTLLAVVTNTPMKLLATVRSRCQTIRFVTPPASLAERWLAMQLGTVKDFSTLLTLSDGAPLKALALATDELTSSMRQTVFDDLRGLAEQRSDPVAVAANWTIMQKAGAEVLPWMARWIMDLIRLRFSAAAPRLTSSDVRQNLLTLAGHYDLGTLYTCLDKLNEAQSLISKQVNIQLLLEDVLVSWCTSGKAT
jgi:DNA polymerase-3 subunit delta'